MNPDQYMPFHGNDFFQAMTGQSANVIGAYISAIWFYWHNTKCSGLRDDDRFLRTVCRVEKDEWEAVKAVLFASGDFFKKENGIWQQKRAREEFEKSKTLLQRNRNKTEAARTARWQNG